jgi:hypothetical protein
MPKGGKLSSQELKGFLSRSYTPTNEYNGYILDKELSKGSTKVYTNPITKQTIVSHKGTEGLSDWYNNAVYAIGGIKQYKKTQRYKDAETVQREAEQKYGKENIDTIGHSQGGIQASLLGRDTKNIITYNAPQIHKQKEYHPEQVNIRTEYDPISAINPHITHTIKTPYVNPITSHTLQGLEHTNDIYGRNIRLIKQYKRI